MTKCSRMINFYKRRVTVKDYKLDYSCLQHKLRKNLGVHLTKKIYSLGSVFSTKHRFFL